MVFNMSFTFFLFQDIHRDILSLAVAYSASQAIFIFEYGYGYR